MFIAVLCINLCQFSSYPLADSNPPFLVRLCDAGARACKHFFSARWHSVRLCQIEDTAGTLQGDVSRKAFPFWVPVLLPCFYSAQGRTPGSTPLHRPSWPVPAAVSGQALLPPPQAVTRDQLQAADISRELGATYGPGPACILWQISSSQTSRLCIPVAATLFSKRSEPQPGRGRALPLSPWFLQSSLSLVLLATSRSSFTPLSH